MTSFLTVSLRHRVYRRIYKADSETEARSFANLFSGSAIEESGVWLVYI